MLIKHIMANLQYFVVCCYHSLLSFTFLGGGGVDSHYGALLYVCWKSIKMESILEIVIASQSSRFVMRNIFSLSF